MESDLCLRLRKIEGQVRGIHRMVEDGRTCGDLLTQLMAVRSAIDSVSISLLTEHVDDCLAEGQLPDGAKGAINEALRLFLRVR